MLAAAEALCDLKLRCTLRRQLRWLPRNDRDLVLAMDRTEFLAGDVLHSMSRMEHGGHAYEAAFAGGPSDDQFLR